MTIQDNGYPKADQGRLRKTIRKKLVEILKNNTDAGANVWPNASVPPFATELPVILVYPRTESASEYAIAPRELERDIDFSIEIIGQGPEVNDELATPEGAAKSLEDILDDIAEQVENLIDVDETLQGLCSKSILTNTEFEFDSSGGVPIGAARLTYSVTYYTMSPRDSLTQAPDDLTTSEIGWNIGEDEDTREATDTVTVP